MAPWPGSLAAAGPFARAARQAAWRAFLPAFGLVALSAVYVNLTGDFRPDEETDYYHLTSPFEGVPLAGLLDALAGSLVHWDASWYLSIADDGYVQGEVAIPTEQRAAFFPLYPLMVRVVSGLGSSPAVIVLAAYAISICAFLTSLYFLHRLVEVELGERYARPALLFLALFPTAFFFFAPYSESLFLALTLGAFYAARTGRFAWAGVAAAGASGTRSIGVALLLPLAILYLWGPRADREPRPAGGLRPRYRLRPDALWLALVPLGVAVFSAYMSRARGDALAWAHTQEGPPWEREFFPLSGVWKGASEAANAIGDLASTTPGAFAGSSGALVDFAFLAFAVAAAIGVARRLPAAYAAWVAVAIAIPLSSPEADHALISFPRYVAVVFPIFMWLALVCEERGITRGALTVSAALLVVLTTQFAAWEWVA